MTEKEYIESGSVSDLIGHLSTTRQSVRKGRLFSIACIQEIRHLIADCRTAEAFRYALEKVDLKSFRRLPGLVRAAELANAAAEEAEFASRNLETPPIEMMQVDIRVYSAHAVGTLLDKRLGTLSANLIVIFCERVLHCESFLAAQPPDWLQSPKRESQQLAFLRDIFGNPFQPVTFEPAWRTPESINIAGRMYDSRDFSAMPILADALEEGGCTNSNVLLHCREPGAHVRGCWVVDLVLGKS